MAGWMGAVCVIVTTLCWAPCPTVTRFWPWVKVARLISVPWVTVTIVWSELIVATLAEPPTVTVTTLGPVEEVEDDVATPFTALPSVTVTTC